MAETVDLQGYCFLFLFVIIVNYANSCKRCNLCHQQLVPLSLEKIISREIAAREDEEEEISEAEGAEAKDQICSANGVEILDTHQISVGLHGTQSKTSITRRQMTKMLVNLLILVLLHIVILELMK